MSILETVLIFVGIPLVIYAAIAGLSYLGKPLAGEKPAHFDLGQKWTQPPVLWSATDEVTGHSHHPVPTPHVGSTDYDPQESHGTHAAIESTGVELIGGRASGRF
ncbi:aa3-type cytochrome oxidase subunit CtaJ [Nocardia goodfellowii]|uniref:Uncharacterized protein n=1 Tax=Nocardia goodfellowii TaxID=882446 RepID=A0ABS4QR54_9NOCA|nr:hypothetical protein [Nocardia goodfellowii]MBP2194193.1 hypothetical protein [Nocardia goodfellowii]